MSGILKCVSLLGLVSYALGSAIDVTALQHQSTSDSLADEAVKELEFAQNITRKEKVFPLFSAVRFTNAQCTSPTSDRQMGTCVSSTECTREGGTPSGNCGSGFGVCCIYSLSCGATTSRTNVYFTSGGLNTALGSQVTGNSATDGATGVVSCTLKVTRQPDICQLRLDFSSFTIDQPNNDGVCDNDRFSTNGAGNNPPTICGNNANQHMILSARPGNADWTLRFTLNSLNRASNPNRNWNMRIRQIACNSDERSDSSCVQYFPNPNGRIQSFNFANINNGGLTTAQRGSQLSNQNYPICIKSDDGACSIRYSVCTDGFNSDPKRSTSFGLTGDFAITPSLEALSGIFCQWDYLQIPGGYNEANQQNPYITTDRFCGTALNPVFLAQENVRIVSNRKPFMLRFVTDNFEVTQSPTNPLGPDGSNTGFCLDYTQLQCSS